MGGKAWRIGKAKEEKEQAHLSPKQTRKMRGKWQWEICHVAQIFSELQALVGFAEWF